jgi:hypothetical protein
MMAIQLQGTGEPPADGVAVPVRIHESMRLVIAEAAAAWVTGWAPANSVANPTGPLGGVAVKAGAIPVPTVAANALKAVSMPGAAAGEANAVASAPASVEAAALTVVEAGTISAA